MKDSKIKNIIFLFIFVLAGVIGLSLKVEACTETRSCPAYCDNHRYYDAPDQSCTYSKACCGTCCGEYGCWCCRGYSCACATPCTPPPCPYKHVGTDSDKDGYDAECDDCDDSNSLVNPGVSNPYCDCNSSTPAEHSSTTGIPETTDCECEETDYLGDDPQLETCVKFKEGCLCQDGYDNDCDGKTDIDDPDCPRLGYDWVIAKDTTLSKDLNVNGLYILSGTLTIDGVTLTVSKDRGIRISDGRIEIKNGGRIEIK